MGVREEPALTAVFKGWQSLPMRGMATLRVRKLFGVILIAICGSEVVSKRHMQFALHNCQAR